MRTEAHSKMPIEYIDHGTEELYCPRCEAKRDGSVSEQSPPGIVGWSCPACDYTNEIGEVPINAIEYGMMQG